MKKYFEVEIFILFSVRNVCHFFKITLKDQDIIPKHEEFRGSVASKTSASSMMLSSTLLDNGLGKYASQS